MWKPQVENPPTPEPCSSGTALAYRLDHPKYGVELSICQPDGDWAGRGWTVTPLYAGEAATPTDLTDAYRLAIDEALMVRHLGIAKGNARDELNQILSWEVAVALDPRVSESAQALINQGSRGVAQAAPEPKFLTMLKIIAAAGGEVMADDSPHSWLNYFCDDVEPTDTFNQAVKAGYLRVTHDNRFDSSTAFLTEAGRSVLSSTEGK